MSLILSRMVFFTLSVGPRGTFLTDFTHPPTTLRTISVMAERSVPAMPGPQKRAFKLFTCHLRSIRLYEAGDFLFPLH